MNLHEQTKIDGVSELQLNVIMGSLMGDAYVPPIRCKTGKTSIIFQHSTVQEDYMMYKYKILQKFTTRPPKRVKNSGFGAYLTRLDLKATKTFGCLYAMLHPDGVKPKTITATYLNHVTHPIALALWFMDDGNVRLHSNNACISTQGFTEPEVDLLVEWLMSKWGIKSHKQRSVTGTGKERHLIMLETEGRIRMVQLIAPFVPQSMHYKVYIRMQVCPACGRVMVTSRSQCCSSECTAIWERVSREVFAQELPKLHAAGMKANRRHWMVEHQNILSAHVLWKRGLIDQQEMEKRLSGPVTPLPAVEEENKTMLDITKNAESIISQAGKTPWQEQRWVPYVLVPQKTTRTRKKIELSEEKKAEKHMHTLNMQRAWMSRLRQDKKKYAAYLKRARERYHARKAARTTTGTA